MDKIDFKKTLPTYRAKHHEFQLVEVPPTKYLMIDGHGDPNTSKEFAESIQALFPVAYKLKFSSKNDLGRDYAVMPLEGLWWADNMDSFTTSRDKSQWNFTLMIMQPEWVTDKMFSAAVARAAEKSAPTLLHKVRLETLDEGLAVQTLHIGSFDDETAILDEMHHKYIPEHNFQLSGKHHEIYFSDFRKVAPEKLKTILRQPVRPI